MTFARSLGQWAVILMMLVACGQAAGVGSTPGAATTQPAAGASQDHDAAISDQTSFVDHLRGLGLTVEVAGEVEQPFFRAKGTTLRVSGGDIAQPAELQSFSYEQAPVAEEDAQQIGPDGSPRTAMITWIAPPHFFRKERLIVIYLGSDQAMLKLLTDTLGPQFAGS